jgi:glycosyltransferase involved in cell wall biosynthesis
MNCLNGERYLREAIDSVFSQTYQDWEIIFWDNASTDNSAAIAKDYGERVRYFRSPETYPLGRARNLALQQVRGQYVAFLDCDDLWLPQKLEKQVPLFERNPRVGLVFCDTYSFNEAGFERQHYRRHKPPRGDLFRDMLRGSFVLQMPGVVIRRKALDGLDGWFDERFNIVEETDLFTRIAYHWEFDYVDEPLAKWRVHQASWTWSKKELIPRETELMLEKFHVLYDDFAVRFKREVACLRAYTEYRYALIDWEQGNRRLVRQRLRPFLTVDPRLCVPWCLSFFPYPVYFNLFLAVRYGTRFK